MKRKSRIAILGAGVMGSTLALFMARKGADVTLFDSAEYPFSAASRWNEGKIHLGYIYNADPSLRTAQHVMTGGLKFQPLMEELIGCSIAPVITSEDDIYLCHRDSVVKPDAMEAYMQQVTQLLRDHSDAVHYLTDTSKSQIQRLSATELMKVTASEDIVAGFRVPERSVMTTWIADRVVEAITAEKRIAQQMNTRVISVHSQEGSRSGAWEVRTTLGTFSSYDYVFNALWQGRMAIDQTAGLQPSGDWSNRYRQSLFVHTTQAIDTPCVVIATGPFGDVKNYNGRDFYLSWYPDGLLVDSSAISPPELQSLEMPDHEVFAGRVFDRLQTYLPRIAEIRTHAESIRVEGGWVFAAGRGALSSPSSTLHRRSDYGVTQNGTYLSIDTGKYSTAPWLARTLADSIMG